MCLLHGSGIAPPLAYYLVSCGLFKDEHFCLIDVGVGGGIEKHWEVFASSLTACGFEPLVAETSRLNAATSPNIRYEAACVTSRDR